MVLPKPPPVSSVIQDLLSRCFCSIQLFNQINIVISTKFTLVWVLKKANQQIIIFLYDHLNAYIFLMKSVSHKELVAVPSLRVLVGL